MKKIRLVVLNILLDLLSVALSWVIFYSIRFFYLAQINPNNLYYSNELFLGTIFIPIFWVASYAFFRDYSDLIKSRMKELFYTSLHAFGGTVVLFFYFLGKNNEPFSKHYYLFFGVFFIAHFLITLIFRLIFFKVLHLQFRKGKGVLRTLLIGNSNDVTKVMSKVHSFLQPFINQIQGCVLMEHDLPSLKKSKQLTQLKVLGSLSQLDKVILDNDINQVIICFTDKKTVKNLICRLADYEIKVKTLPQKEDISLGFVKSTAIYQSPFIDVSFDSMPFWQRSIKFLFDKIVSLVFIILFSPIYLITSLAIKLTSKGPVFFLQERIGYKGDFFKIIKFRSMVMDAEEKSGPLLSSQDDTRITSFGKFMRRTRLDETPQFFNVLKGDMSLVGPRPERQFFVNKIVKKAPEYKLIKKVKPGITSWGQVKYGYAENVNQMIRRLDYDLLYLRNRSLYLDFKILVHTVMIVFKREGI